MIRVGIRPETIPTFLFLLNIAHWWHYSVQGVQMKMAFFIILFIVLKNSGQCHVIWSGLGPTFMASSVGWFENTRMSTQSICYLYWKKSK